MRIGLIFGGPSTERGVSLNSARSAMDHLTSLGWDVVPFYCDLNRNFYRVSLAQLYSNTPSDFDFKLANIAQPLSLGKFIDACHLLDIVFPLIHGEFGEDGALQELLENNNIPFVGSSSKSCRRMFNKVKANIEMADMTERGFSTLPNCIVEESDAPDVRLQKVEEFFEYLHIQKVVVKPSVGGSSIGVATAQTPEEAVKCANNIFTNKQGSQAMIEPYCKGHEFTVIVLQNQEDKPVALIPTEIDLLGGEIFTYRNKYLPSHQVEYHCPPRFNDEYVKQIQKSAECLFSHFEMRDFSRLDGRILDDRQLIFSDFNPVSGMEQVSNMFIQSSRIGFGHSDMLRYIVTHAAKRYGINCDVDQAMKNPDAQKIRILFGGESTERQVSVMSGTNVWLKTLYAVDFLSSPYILAPKNEVWQLPYSFVLNYTVEEILAHCAEAEEIVSRLKVLVPPLCERLGMEPLTKNVLILPRRISFDQFCQEAAEENAFVFIALHGGEGEDGRVQAKLNQYNLAYNGSDVEASHLCIDKHETGKVLSNLKDPFLISAPKILIPAKKAEKSEKIWKDATQKLKTNDILIKPQADGCSMGVARLKSANDLKIYLQAIEHGQKILDEEMLEQQSSLIELPMYVDNLMLEPYIVTDEIYVDGFDLVHKSKTCWIELTISVLEDNGIYHALSPSVTLVKLGSILSLEDKFQGGTGINLTPPPDSMITNKQLVFIKTKIEKAAKSLGIQGYARIDIFFNTKSDQIMVIEANSLPSLTPSTVIYHQALAEVPPLTPQAFLFKLIKLGIKRRMERNLVENIQK
ncbi:hypothetical protein ACSAZL_11690 [Methanosarcina sp. T3]|uniref:hypothetical protein n=1 Tax=Methanosarcina sp. T3 TaxID=3439062 RepID=UPI003F8240E8